MKKMELSRYSRISMVTLTISMTMTLIVMWLTVF